MVGKVDLDGYLNKLNSFVIKNHRYLLAFILIFAFVVRMYYFLQHGNQALWYDEADYMLRSQSMAFGIEDSLYAHKKPVLMPLLWSVFLKIGLGEIFIKLVQVLISTVTVYFVYLLGKEAKSKEVGLIMAGLLATFYLHIFFAIRVMLDDPAIMFTVLAMYFFIRWYKYHKLKDSVLAGLFLSLSIQVFYIPMYLGALFLVFLWVTRRLNFLKDKQVWVALGVLVASIIPWLFWNFLQYGNAFFWYLSYSGTGSVLEGYDHGLFGFLKVFPDTLFTPMFVAFALGLLLVVLDFYFNWSAILRRKTKKFDMDILFFGWLAIVPLALSKVIVHVEPRYMLPAMVAAFYFVAVCLMFVCTVIYEKAFKKRWKELAFVLVFLFVIFVSVSQLSYAHTLIESKSSGFEQERFAGYWLNQNLEEDEVYITCNQQVVLESYSARKSYAFGSKEERLIGYIEDYAPKYLVVDGYVGDCLFEYPDNHVDQFELKQVFFVDDAQTQPIVLIYEILY
jgi:4-amino-4-deoxy-L-arabinose transferase-like glycosyltransferase